MVELLTSLLFSRMKLFYIIILIGAGLSACSSYSIYSETDLIEVTSKTETNTRIDSIIQPYKDSLSAEMNSVIGIATDDFIRDRPEGALGNFVADLSLKYCKETIEDIKKCKVICIMNHGGLRSPISKGEVTVGDIFKLMPFDNQLVVLKLDESKQIEIEEYLKTSGGEPIAGFTITEKGMDIPKQNIYVVTTDYLASGGDKMNFFLNPLGRIDTGVLLRDVIINHVKSEGTISPVIDNRINFKDE